MLRHLLPNVASLVVVNATFGVGGAILLEAGLGFLASLQQMIQGLDIDFPYQLLLALPYFCTILALVVGRNRSGAPLSLGISYSREST